MSDSNKGVFEKDEMVLIIYDFKRRWMKKITEDNFHTNYGFINLADLVGMSYGSSIQTSKGKWLKLVPPTMMDWIDSFEHQSQIIYAKDAAMITLLLDAH